MLYFEDLVGAKLIRHRTLGKYLDGQPQADPDKELPPDIWYVERKAAENNEAVQFELASALDFAGVQLRCRQIVANVCWWLSCGGYRRPYCGYNGWPVADENEIIVTDASRDKCGGGLCALARTTPCRVDHSQPPAFFEADHEQVYPRRH